MNKWIVDGYKILIIPCVHLKINYIHMKKIMFLSVMAVSVLSAKAQVDKDVVQFVWRSKWLLTILHGIVPL